MEHISDFVTFHNIGPSNTPNKSFLFMVLVFAYDKYLSSSGGSLIMLNEEACDVIRIHSAMTWWLDQMRPLSAIQSWRHQMETYPALLAICAGDSPVSGEFPSQRPVTRSFDVFFDLHPNKRLSKQWRGWWFETPSCPLWRHRNVSEDWDHLLVKTYCHIVIDIWCMKQVVLKFH